MQKLLTPALRRLIQYEADAKSIHCFYTILVPGRLQTRAYAYALLKKFAEDLSPEEIEHGSAPACTADRHCFGRRHHPTCGSSLINRCSTA